MGDMAISGNLEASGLWNILQLRQLRQVQPEAGTDRRDGRVLVSSPAELGACRAGLPN